jgi:hypothetical protein
VSNWPLVAAARLETIGAATGQGTTITTGASNTKGSYASIGTTGFAYRGFYLSIDAGGGSRYRFDIAINTGGSDDIIVEDFYFDATISVNNSTAFVWVPVAIPAGATVKGRAQAAAGAQTLLISILGYQLDAPGHTSFRACRSATDFTNTDPTNSVTQTGQTVTAWEQICSSTVARFAALYVTPSIAGDTSRTISNFLADVGFGASGSERALLTGLQGKQSTSGLIPDIWGPVWCDLPAGTRLAGRVQCSASAAADTFALACNGLVA